MDRESVGELNDDQEKGLKENRHYSEDINASPDVLEQWNSMSYEEQAKFERKLLWKLDLRLIPWLSLLYLLSFLDRTNIGNAKIQGVTIPPPGISC